MSNPRHILFISYDGLTDPLGQSQILPYLLGLTKAGYHFTVLSCEKPERFNKNQSYIQSLISTYSIHWAPVPYHKKPPILSSIYDVWVMKRRALALHRLHRFDMVHTRAGLPALVGLWLKRKTGVKFLHDIREFYADGRVDGGIWNVKRPHYRAIYNYFKKKESDEIKNCDGIVCLTHAAEKILKSLPEYRHEIPLTVIPCSVDTHLFDPFRIRKDQQITLANSLGILSQNFVISYLGSLGTWYMINEMLQLLSVIRKKIPALTILFITPHSKAEVLSAAQRNLVPEEHIICVQAKRDEVPMYLSLSNFSIFFIKPCYSKLSSSPTKHGEIMSMGIPLITNTGVGDIDEILEDTGSGLLVKDFDKETFNKVAETVGSYVSDERYFSREKIIAGAKKYYSLEEAIEKYRKLYDQILR